MTTTRFDQLPDVNYAHCLDCSEVFPTAAEQSAHGQATMTPTGETTGVTARGHRSQIDNPTRPERIRSAIVNAVNDAASTALDEIVDDIERLVERDGVTLAEVDELLKTGMLDGELDVREAWREYISENYDEEERA